MSHPDTPPGPPELGFTLPDSHRNAMRLGDERYQRDSPGLFAELRRRHGPVAPVLLSWDVPAWLVMGYSELLQVTSDPELFARSFRRWNMQDHLPPEWPMWPLIGGGFATEAMLYTEGEEHRRRSAVLGDAFARIDQWEFEEFCRRASNRLIEEFSQEGEAELISAYAQRLPVLALGWAVGVPEDYHDALVTGFLQLMGAGGDPIEGLTRVGGICDALARRAVKEPGPYIASHLAHSGLGLTHSQLSADIFVSIIAGHQTCANWIGNTIRLMLTDQTHTNALTRGRRSVTEAAREVLKDDTPTQIFAGRWAARTTQLAGTTIPSGDLVLLGLAATHQDPLFRPPGQAREHHHSRAYLSFSHGPHGCPHTARTLAEIITVSGIETLLTQLPDLHLGIPADRLRWQPQVLIRALESLPVRFTPPALSTDPLGDSLWL
ncbi:cytochrome P450 [Nocardiopsis sp. MG754419]|uniref:cytochrome P450 n=1 Tax=Nocardiopsis sp. MG754419 TaxID=2259865 RepID=UPI001BA64A6A|nr:cytochrome P450 [Nocardiopsis sp. MG754419]MBR8744057.1 cytochrome P450 [Nocardiopsis sp. MG754419]